MLIEIADVAPAESLVMCRSSLGEALVRWRGAEPPVPGPHRVEWTVDVKLEWGGNAVTAPAATAGVRMDDDAVVLCGRLKPQLDDTGVLELGETFVLLELATPVPVEVWNSWIELRAPSTGVEIYPYEI